jgi:3,4-dihydroxy-2-butanone 4-phosphate synthase
MLSGRVPPFFVAGMLKVHDLEAILDRLRLGCPAILLDDRKEAEGDLFCPAAVASAEVLQFMVRRASGLLCMSLPRTRLEEIGIPRLSQGLELLADSYVPEGKAPLLAGDLAPWARFLQSLRGRLADTPFHFPVDLAGHHSGISVVERLETIQALLQPAATIDWFTVPGHLATLGAHPLGLAGRWGHTEASVDLCRALGLEPAGLLCEIVGDDGGMMRGEELEAFARDTRIDLLPLSAVANVVKAGPVKPPV